MKSAKKNILTIQTKDFNSKKPDLQKLYSERLERFMALVELSYALKTAPRIIHKK